MVKEQTLGVMETCMKGNPRMGKDMVKGPTLGLVETSMKGNTRMGKLMEKEHKLFLMGENGQVSSEKINVGTPQFTTKTETSLESL